MTDIQPPTPTEKKARLLKLADTVESQKVKGHFDLNVVTTGTGPTPFDCGSAACAMGLLPAADPHGPFEWIVDRNTMILARRGTGREAYFSEVYNYLGLTLQEGDRLFMPDCYPNGHRNAKYVANRIRRYALKINTEGAPR